MRTPFRVDVLRGLWTRARDREGRELKVATATVRLWLHDPRGGAPSVSWERLRGEAWEFCKLSDLTREEYGAAVEYVATRGWSEDPRVKSVVIDGCSGHMRVTFHDGTTRNF